MVGNLATVLAPSLSKAAFVALGIASAVAAALSAKWLHEIRVGRLLQKWMTTRSAAETQRLRYFDLAIERSYADSSDEPDLTALLQLEYFRRFQLAVQLAFLRERGSDHERVADQTLRLGGIAVGIASLVTCVAGFLGVVHPPLASLAAVGVMGAALAGFANTRDAISQDRRNAERYGRTADALKGLRAELPRVRQATARGSREALGQFAEAVHEQLSTEHRQWVEVTESTSAALARLAQTLSAVEDQCGTK